MNGPGKSDRPVVPAKSPNKAGRPAAEAMKGRGLAKGNAGGQNALRTQSREGAPSALDRVREAAKQNKGQRFTALLHHVDVARLDAAFRALKKDAAPGVDAVDTGAVLGGSLGRRAASRLRQRACRLRAVPRVDGSIRLRAVLHRRGQELRDVPRAHRVPRRGPVALHPSRVLTAPALLAAEAGQHRARPVRAASSARLAMIVSPLHRALPRCNDRDQRHPTNGVVRDLRASLERHVDLRIRLSDVRPGNRCRRRARLG
jgi:hypothetical protein